MHSPELLKGTLQTIVLKVLSDHGKMYGYEIAHRVKDLSEGTIHITEGALYPTLHRMVADGMLNTEVVYVGRRVRKYYELTSIGQSVVEEKLKEFAGFIRTMRHVLNLRSV
jgi:PadR family transcriptional regulator, regulatory protein PadR